MERIVDRPANAGTPRTCLMPLEPKTGSAVIPRCLVVGDNRMLRPISKNDNLKELCQQFVSEETSNSVLFRAALNKLNSVPIDIINHFAHLGEFSKFLWENQKIADVHIRLGDKMYCAHRITLACFSEYFQQIFFSQGEDTPLPFEMNLIGLSQHGFQAFLDYIYSGKLDLNSESIAELLTVAESLGVPNLKSKCFEYADAINVNQALLIIQCCSPETRLFNLAFGTILQNFRTLDNYENFFRLDIDTMCAILSNNSIHVETEFEVFRVGMNWLMFNRTERQPHAMRMMHCIRFGLMAPTEVKQCANLAEILRDDATFQDIIFKAHW